ncbi:hypothetical protein ACFS3C_26510 [Azotobacter vinelandii]
MASFTPTSFLVSAKQEKLLPSVTSTTFLQEVLSAEAKVVTTGSKEAANNLNRIELPNSDVRMVLPY